MHGAALFKKTKLIRLGSSPWSLLQCPASVAYHLSPHYCDLTTIIATLQTCAQQKHLRRGKETHCYILKNGLFGFPAPVTSLINMYSKCNKLGYAIRVFNTASLDINVFIYNAIIAGFVSHGQSDKGIKLYQEMRETGILPDKFTFPSVLKGFSDVVNASEIKKTHGLVFKLELASDLFVASALVNCYMKLGLMQDAEKLFDQISSEDVVLWNSMINGYARTGQFNKSLEIFEEMCEVGLVPSTFTITGVLSVVAEMGDLENGRTIHGFVEKIGYGSSVPVCNALIDMYSKCKSIELAVEIFETMTLKDLYSWNSIISAHESCGNYDETLRLFRRMLTSKLQPDLITVTSVLPACANLAALTHGKAIHGHILTNGGNYNTADVAMNNSIMDMYTKCGSTRDALLVFENMSDRDVASWSIMIMGYAMHGYGKEALDFFKRMCVAGLRPDMVTCIGVLSACSHCGFLEEGREFLDQMESLYGVVPSVEHYTCVVDMLGRANQLEEAYEIARSIPLEANSVVWRALLAASRLHGNVEIAEIASGKVVELDPEHCGSYVLMSNAYVAAGRYEKVGDVRDMMRLKNVKKVPGCSWIELKDGVHAFINSDKTHPLVDSIYSALLSLIGRVHDHGYAPSI